MAPRTHEDADEAFDAADHGEPHVGEHDEAILYADALDRWNAAVTAPDAPVDGE